MGKHRRAGSYYTKADPCACQAGDVFLIAGRVRYVGQSDGALARVTLNAIFMAGTMT